MKQKKSTVVRHEDFGYLIWSPELDSYFLVNKEVEDSLNLILHRKKTGETDIFRGIDNSFAQELKSMGFQEDVKEINNSLEDKLSAPLEVYYDFTFACNLKCSYCYNFYEDRQTTMSNENIEKVLTEMADNGVMRTHLAGGEPLIKYDKLQTYLQTAAKGGMNASVNSNGTLLTDELLNLIFDNDVKTLTFSLDGHTANLNDMYRGKGNFDKARAKAKMAKHEKNKKGNNLKLQYKAVHFFNTPLEVYEGLINLSIEDGMDRIQFHNPECSLDHPKGHYAKKEIIEGYYERIKHLEKLKEKYGDQIDIWSPWNPITGCRDIGIPGYTGCIGGQELIAINPKGDITPCLMNKYQLGNLFSDWDGKFSQFWRESKRLNEFQNQTSKIDPRCEPCEVYSQCRGGRKTRIIVNNRDGNSERPVLLSDISGYDPYCAKDFMQEKEFPLKREDFVPMNNLKQIYVAHSL